MMSTMVARPYATARELPAVDAVCRYEPNPGSRNERGPNENSSQIISENQPLATETMEFHIRPMAANGSSSCRARCNGENRLI